MARVHICPNRYHIIILQDQSSIRWTQSRFHQCVPLLSLTEYPIYITCSSTFCKRQCFWLYCNRFWNHFHVIRVTQVSQGIRTLITIQYQKQLSSSFFYVIFSTAWANKDRAYADFSSNLNKHTLSSLVIANVVSHPPKLWAKVTCFLMSETFSAILLILRILPSFFFVGSDNVAISAVSLFQKYSNMISKSVPALISITLLPAHTWFTQL